MQKKENDIKKLKEELEKNAENLAGWENLRVRSIQKYGAEAVIDTTQGFMKMSMRELFIQQLFRTKVFETFGIMIDKVKVNVYEAWLAEWAKTIKDMGMEYGTSVDILREALFEYLESAEEGGIAYLRKGIPVIVKDGQVAFKSLDFTIYLKKKYQMTYSEDQIRAILRKLGCVPQQIGRLRIRAWTMSMPDAGDGDDEGSGIDNFEQEVEIKFVGKGKAPEVMNDESGGSESLIEDDF